MDSWAEAADGVLEASALLLINGSREAWLFNVKGGVRRGVEEPQTESVIRGPREGFTETLRKYSSDPIQVEEFVTQNVEHDHRDRDQDQCGIDISGRNSGFEPYQGCQGPPEQDQD